MLSITTTWNHSNWDIPLGLHQALSNMLLFIIGAMELIQMMGGGRPGLFSDAHAVVVSMDTDVVIGQVPSVP